MNIFPHNFTLLQKQMPILFINRLSILKNAVLGKNLLDCVSFKSNNPFDDLLAWVVWTP